jgi:hypothetical protein
LHQLISGYKLAFGLVRSEILANIREAIEFWLELEAEDGGVKAVEDSEVLFQKNHAGSSQRFSMSMGTPQGREELMALLRSTPRSPSKLRGVWELRWSSSSQPWLMQGPLVENLQVLDPARNRGMNLLRLHGPLGAVAAISVVAHLEVAGEQRVTVRFERGGWIGLRIGSFRPEQVQLARPLQSGRPVASIGATAAAS